MEPTPARILCVDDNLDTRKLLQLFLGGMGFTVTTTDSVAQSLALARQQPFDLYILDNTLPDGTGQELCARLREMAPETPVLHYTGALLPENAEKILDECGHRHLTKPATLDELLRLIRQLLPSAEPVDDTCG